MRFESHFKSYFGNVKAFNLKKFKIIAERLSLSPSPQWPEAACGWGAMAGEFLRQSLGRTVFGKESGRPGAGRAPGRPDQLPIQLQAAGTAAARRRDHRAGPLAVPLAAQQPPEVTVARTPTTSDSHRDSD